jgi:hypothetical protein
VLPDFAGKNKRKLLSETTEKRRGEERVMLQLTSSALIAIGHDDVVRAEGLRVVDEARAQK